MLVNSTKRTSLFSTALVALAGSVTLVHSVAAEDLVKQAARLNTLPVPAIQASINGAKPDVSALRYYAVRGNQARVQAELNRLRTLYPNWKQPDNIFAEDADEEKGLWKLFSEGKIDLVKAEIKKMQKTVAGYIPSDDLITKLEERGHRSEISKAWVAKDWKAVIDSANKHPALLTGRDVELIWFVAEAYAKLERPKDSYDAFSAALVSSKSQQERKATLQKAATVLSAEMSLTLLEGAPKLSKDPIQVGAVEDAIVRGALARSAELGEAAPSDLVQRIAAFEERSKETGAIDDAVLLAWANFGQSKWQKADIWFTRALASQVGAEPNPKAIEGAIMSAMRLNKLDRAAQLAGQWLESSDEIGALFISIHAKELLQAKPRPMASDFLQAYAGKTASLSNGEGAEALGWYAYNTKQLDAAKAWFSKAAEWEETETAIFGLALTASGQKDKASFDHLKANYGPKYTKLASLKYQVEGKKRRVVQVKRRSQKVSRAGNLRAQIARLHNAKHYAQCLRKSRNLRQFGPLKAGDHQMRGWCLMGAKRPAEAQQAFATAVRMGGSSRAPSAYGQALAALRNGKTNAALAIANANKLTRKQRRTIDVELLTQRARASFANKDYSATVDALNKRAKLVRETRDLTMLRGWAHFNSNRLASALDIFETLDQQLSTRDSKRGLNAAKRQLGRNPANEL